MKEKEQAYADYINVIRNSWTYGRMTELERARMWELFGNIEEPIGNYSQRIKTFTTIYTAFLYGLGYSGFNWREPGTIEAQ